MKLRPMRWWDIEPVMTLERELFVVDPWSTEQFWSELAQPTRHYVVAEADQRIRGYAGLSVVGPHADVHTIAVAPHAQGAGIGTALLQELLGHARDCSSVFLEVRSDNAPAIALYQRFGFQTIDRRREYYGSGIDALIMRLRPVPHG